MTQRDWVPMIFAVLASAVSPESSFAGSSKKMESQGASRRGCEGLSAAIRTEFRVPYKAIKSRLSRDCAGDDQLKATEKTLHLFVAVAFYHEDLATRKDAIQKLRQYPCERKSVCQELRRLVEAHAEAALKINSTMARRLKWDWAALRGELRDRAGF